MYMENQRPAYMKINTAHLWKWTKLELAFLCRWHYRKFSKHSNTQQICCNHSKIWTMWLYHRVMSPNDADGMANSVDLDQTAPRSSLIWVCTVCPSISVRKLRIITVNNYGNCEASLFNKIFFVFRDRVIRSSKKENSDNGKTRGFPVTCIE